MGKAIPNLLIILAFQCVIFSQNAKTPLDQNNWELSLTEGDTLQAINILFETDDSVKILIARDIILELYEKDSLDDVTIVDLGYSYLFFNQLEKAELYFNKAIKINNFNEGAFYNLACIYFRKKKMDKGFLYLEESFKRGSAYDWIYEDPDLIEARKDLRFKELEKLYWSSNDKKFDSILTEGMSNSNPRSAIKIFKKASALEKKTPYPSPYILDVVYAQITDLYEDLGNLNKAIEYTRKSIEVLETIDDSWWLGIRYSFLGYKYADVEQWDNAINNWKQAAIIFEKLGDYDKVLSMWSHICGQYRLMADFEKSIIYGEKYYNY